MKKMMKRAFSGLLSLAVVAALLPVSVFAADCEHQELIKGVCQNESCKAEFAAKVDETLYKTLNDAIAAAEEKDPAAVQLLQDLDLSKLEGESLSLGAVYLFVSGEEKISIANGTLIGEHERQVVLADGELILDHVNIINEAGTYAVVAEGTEEKPVQLSVIGGEYSGKSYGIGLKDAQLLLNGYVVTEGEGEEEQETVVLPVMEGETAAIHLENAIIEVMRDLGDKVYSVDCESSGVFAHISGYNTDSVVNEAWFENSEAEFDEENGQWLIPAAPIELTAEEIALELSDLEDGYVYSGDEIKPEVVLKTGETVISAEEYSLTYENNDAAGTATVSVTAVDDGTYKFDALQQTFEIQPAVLTVASVTAENKVFDGKDTVKITAVTLNGICGDDEVAVVVEGLNGTLADDAVGTYDSVTLPTLQLTGKDAHNYSLTQPAQAVTVSVEIVAQTDAELTLQVNVPEGGYVYTGSEIKASVVVKNGEAEIPADAYTVSYENNIEAGTATVIVKANEGGSYQFEDLTEHFEIKKATAATLTIGGKPAAVTYGDAPFQLSHSGGIEGAAVTWSVKEGNGIAAVDADGKVTVSGVGRVVVQAAQSGGKNYNDQSAEYSFEVKPAALTVESVSAENKAYDGNKSVKITAVVLQGICGSDNVSVAVNGLNGELADSKAAVYDKVTVPALTLAGADAGKYTLTQPSAAVKTNVTVSKAEVPTALKGVQTTVAVDTENLEIEHLAEGMPADAGALRYTTKHQDTSDGAKVIVLDWGVDKNGKLTSKLASGEAGDKVIYEVTIASDNYKDTVVKVEVTLGSLALESSKVTVTPAETELTYDGKEHKPAVEVKYENTVLKSGSDYDVSYPSDTVSAGEKELKVQFKGNYSGSATAKYTVSKAKVSVSGVKAQDKTYDGTTKATVSATLSGVVSGDDVKVNAVGIFADKNSGSNKTINVTYALTGDDAANYELTATKGTTTAKITPVSASSLNSNISGLSTGNADSGNKSALQNVVSRANTALQDSGLSSSEKSGLTNVKYSAEDMISRIESAAAAASTESIRKSADIDSTNVKPEDKALLQKAQSDLNNALNTYSGNYTNGEESELQKKRERIANALNTITRVESAQILIDALPDTVGDDTVVDSKLKTSVEDAQTAFAALNEYEKSLIGEDRQLKLTAVAQAVSGVEPNDDANKDDVSDEISGAPEDGETFEFPTWILVVAVLAAALCGGGLFLYKRKQEENTMNW